MTTQTYQNIFLKNISMILPIPLLMLILLITVQFNFLPSIGVKNIVNAIKKRKGAFPMSKKSKPESKPARKYSNYLELIDYCANNGYANDSFSQFFEEISEKNSNLMAENRKIYDEKLQELENTPMLRKDYLEAYDKLTKEKETVNIHAVDSRFIEKAIKAFVYHKAELLKKDKSIAEEAVYFIIHDCDFLSVMIHMDELRYWECNTEEYNNSLASNNFIGDSFYGRYPYLLSGNLLDKMLKLYFKQN
jgi:hypothetical protein